MRKLWFALAAAAVLVYGSGCSRCHSGHYEIEYHEAYTSLESSKFGDVTIYHTEHHPARCSDWFVCDWTCKTLDQGKAEAHPKHPVLRQVADVVDPRCRWDGFNAEVK